MPDAVSIFAVETTRAFRTIRQRLLDQIAVNSDALASGYAKDFADYKDRTGEIRGLRAALAICDEMTKEENR